MFKILNLSFFVFDKSLLKSFSFQFFYVTDLVLAKRHLIGLHAKRCSVQKSYRAKISHCKNVTVKL